MKKHTSSLLKRLASKVTISHINFILIVYILVRVEQINAKINILGDLLNQMGMMLLMNIMAAGAQFDELSQLIKAFLHVS